MSVTSVASAPSRGPLIRVLQVLATLVVVAAIANCGDGSSPPPAATQLLFTSQPGSSQVAGGPLGTVEVHALDADGKGADFNDDVTIGIQPGSGTPGATVSGIATVKASKGVATFTTLAIQTAGTGYALVATASGLTPTVPSTPFDITAGAAHHLGVTTQPAGATNGQHFGTQPLVQVQDQYNNAVALQGVLVTAAIATGGGVLTGTIVRTTDASGLATFTDLVITGTAAAHTLSFAATNFTSAALSSSFTLGAGSPTHLGIATPPSATAASGQVLNQQPAIQLLDASDNLVATGPGVVVSAAIATGGGALGGTATATTVNGVATFAGLSLSGAVGNRTLVFTAPNLVAVTSGQIAIGAGAPHHLTITTQPSSSAANGAAFLQQPVVEVRDADGNLVTTSTAGVTATISLGGGTLGGGMQVNAAGGRASFSDLAITGTIGARTLSFASGTLVAATSSNINLTPGAADHLTIVTQPSSTAGSGAAFGQQPVVQVRDISENVVTSPVVAVVAAIASGGPALGGTASQNTVNGVATFTNLAISGALGTRTLSFTSGVLPPVTSSNIDVLFGAATQLTITTPPSATAASGEVLAPQPAIQLRDATGNAVPQSGVTITAAIFSGGGSLGSTTTAMTDANGLATFSGLAITGLVGTRTLRFTSGALTPATSGSIAITAGAASQLTITTQPSTTAANGAILGQQPAVQITDGGGNPVSQLGVPVTVAIATGGGTLGGIATVNTNANGLAPFAGLSITGLIGARTLSFTSAPLAAATSNSISITPGAANHLTITTQPGGTTAASGAALAPQPVVEVRDVSENVVTTPAVTVTAAIATGGGTLTGTANPTTVNGVATFTNLVITGLVGARTLSFTSGVLPVVNSASFNLVAGAATQLTITTQPSTTDSNAKVFPIQPVIQLRDGGGNAVSQVVGVTAAITAPGTGTLRGTATVNTSAAGVATFAGLSILAPTVGNRTLTFTSGTLTSVTSGNINITVGTARIMTAVAGTTPQTAPVSTAVGVDPAVLVTDSGGIPVSGRNVIFTVATGGGTLSPASPATIATNASGIATVTSWTLGAVAGTNTLSAASATPAPALTALTFTATGTAVITGTMWVANFGVPSIGIFPAAAVGNVAPTSTLTSTALGGPAFLARDAAGLLYVSDFTNGQVLVFAAGATGAATPVRSITGLLNPAGIALNAAGNLYVADQANATVYVFAANATGALGVGAVPVRTITGAATLMQNPSGIALDGDTLHVADLGGFVSTFGPTATGNVAPLRTIATTDLGTPWGLVEDATGGLWVANQNGGALATGSVVRFARGSDSNTQTVTPTNVLDGVLTTLNGPVGLARSGNNIYVTNFTAGAEAVLVFPTTATGNVAPASTLSGANTGLTQAFGITF